MATEDIWRPPPTDLCQSCQTKWRRWRHYRHPERGVNAWAESNSDSMVMPEDRDAETIVSQQNLIEEICRRRRSEH